MPEPSRGPATAARGLVLPAILAVVAGAGHTASYVTTVMWPLQLAAAGLLYALASRARPGEAFLLGWLFGTAWLVAGTWWLFISMHRYGGLPAPVAAAAVLALAGSLSLYWGLAMAAFARWRSGRLAGDVALFTAAWGAAELARGEWFTGFPWVASGYAHVDAPLAWLAPWTGVYGVGMTAAALGALGAHTLACRHAGAAARAAGPAAAAAVLATAALLPVSRFTQGTGTLDVTLLQTNVAQDEKFAVDRMPEALAWVAKALVDASTPLAVAPETAVPLLPDQLADFAPGYWPALEAHFSAPGRAALVGVPLGNFEQGYTNSVVGLSPDARYRYDKFHLVPFGEFIPTGFRWFTELMNIPLGDFARGRLDAPSFGFGGQRLAPNICYEDLFGEELAVRFRDATTAPTVLVNLSNIGWFGDSVAVPQHLNISRMRSLELQRPMLRATNTGATVAIDHTGQVVASLPPFTRGVLAATVEGRDGLTPFAWWAGQAGLWPAWVLIAAMAATAAAARRRAAR